MPIHQLSSSNPFFRRALIALRRNLHNSFNRFSLSSPILRKEPDLHLLSNSLNLKIECAVDLGCGANIRNPFNAKYLYGCDINPPKPDNDVTRIFECRLGFEELPFPDQSIDAVSAFDLLEHIPRSAFNSASQVYSFPFIFLMNEIWRTLNPGGLFYSLTPCFPMKEAFQDPTHVNIMTEDTLSLYFGPQRWATCYGFTGSFSVISQGWINYKHYCILQKQQAT